MPTSTLQLKPQWEYERCGDKQHYVIEAWLDGELAGRAHGWFEPGGQLTLEKIEIEPAHRSKGYGSALINALREQAREVRCRELVIKGVRVSNHGAIRLYESLGAVPHSASPDLLTFVLAPP